MHEDVTRVILPAVVIGGVVLVMLVDAVCSVD